MQGYHPKNIEPKWQKYWEDHQLFKVEADPSRPKYYLLEMLPYPSGRIHMGHVRNYTIGDVVARFKRMQGFNVLHPMGWDAFGLPAENAAIKNNVPPAEWTYTNIDAMRVQLKKLGYSYDWSREIATCDPEYYRWEQLMFLKMCEKGLVFRKASNINWCEGCNTVLANEQVDKGHCWRCENTVVQKLLEQWYFKLSAYADELLRDVDDKLQGWTERVRVMQREWIGRSEGALIDFKVKGSNEIIQIFTTRPDTLFGVTFMSIACEHPLLAVLTKHGGKEKEVDAFVEKSSHIDRMERLTGEYEKEGIFTGAYAIHPLTGEELPIYAANFVLMDYGTGAVMAVPAHDERDFEFAMKYKLPIKIVIQPEGQTLDAAKMKEAFIEEGKLVSSEKFDGLHNVQAILEITKELERQKVGKRNIQFKLKDWCLSRQRYWGAPIPMIYCDKCGVVPVLEKDLPVVLPKNVKITGQGESPLKHHASFLNTTCPKCKGKAKRETDTMDTFVESSWYFFRYISPKNASAPFDPKDVHYWMPIDQYIGGVEHAVGHLIYCRFFTKVLRDLGFLKLDEPVKNLLTQGMVIKDGVKMSKSKGNVIDPDEMIEKYGADAVRLFILFAAPIERDLDWNEQGLEGMSRFLNRVWRLVESGRHSGAMPAGRQESQNPAVVQMTHKTIKKVSEDIANFQFNTALAALMEYINFLQDHLEWVTTQTIEALVILLSPFAPHFSEELWENMGHKPSILNAPWPKWDEVQLKSDTMTVVVQVNGKLRDTFEVSTDLNEEKIKKQAQTLEKVKSHLAGKQIIKIVYVPKKLVNIVIR